MMPMPVQADVDTEGASDAAVAAVTEALVSFQSSTEGLGDCVGDPEIRFEVLPGRRGEYRSDGTIVINPNRAVEGMMQTTVHELAHHVMFACGFNSDVVFRLAFYRAQGLDLSRGWLDYNLGWSEAPAEHFAETVALVVLGENMDSIPITAAALALVEREFTEIDEGLFIMFASAIGGSPTSVIPPILVAPSASSVRSPEPGRLVWGRSMGTTGLLRSRR